MARLFGRNTLDNIFRFSEQMERDRVRRRKEEQEDRERAENERVKELGKRFLQEVTEFTPENVQDFFQKNNVGAGTAEKLMDSVAVFMGREKEKRDQAYRAEQLSARQAREDAVRREEQGFRTSERVAGEQARSRAADVRFGREQELIGMRADAKARGAAATAQAEAAKNLSENNRKATNDALSSLNRVATIGMDDEMSKGMTDAINQQAVKWDREGRSYTGAELYDTAKKTYTQGKDRDEAAQVHLATAPDKGGGFLGIGGEDTEALDSTVSGLTDLGFSPPEIAQQLKNKGWTTEDIGSSVSRLTGDAAPTPGQGRTAAADTADTPAVEGPQELTPEALTNERQNVQQQLSAGVKREDIRRELLKYYSEEDVAKILNEKQTTAAGAPNLANLPKI